MINVIPSRAKLVVGSFACLAGFLLAQGVASAGVLPPGDENAGRNDESVFECSGALAFSEEGPSVSDLDYKFKCDSNLVGYVITTTRFVDFFETESFVTDPLGVPSSLGEGFSCEGDLPGRGIVCRGDGTIDETDTRPATTGVLAGNTVNGTLGLERNICDLPSFKRTQFYVSGIGERMLQKINGDTGEYGSPSWKMTASPPQRLARPACPALENGSKGKKGKGKKGKGKKGKQAKR